MKKESRFQAGLVRELKERFPGCIVLKNDANYIRGIPDLTVLYKDKWAFLENKRTEKSEHQALQDYYIEQGNEMSFARFICPENKEEVLNELEQTFQPRRKTRVSRRIKVPLD